MSLTILNYLYFGLLGFVPIISLTRNEGTASGELETRRKFFNTFTLTIRLSKTALS